jgi:hypothetical protein
MAYSGGTIRRDAEDIEIELEWSCNRREGKGKQPVEYIKRVLKDPYFQSE